MYSVVLLAAMTTGGEAPDCWFLSRSGCNGCHGWSGWGGGCHGGWGGGCHGGWGGGCHGYWACGGGCSGYGYSGYGCAGYGAAFGGVGCYGSWTNTGWYGGSAWGNYECFGAHGCYGCIGFNGCIGAIPGAPTGPGPEPIPAPKVDDLKGKQALLNRARLTVELPSDAKLYIDDQPMKGRSFNTPRLERGQTYYYEVRAEMTVEGKTVSDTKKVLVRAGQDIPVSFLKLASKALPTTEVSQE